MNLTVAWDNDEKTIIRFSLVGHWTTDDLFAAHHLCQQLEAEVAHSVSYIIDVTHNESSPPHILSITRRLFEEASDKIDMRVVVGANNLAHIFFNTFTTIYGYIARKNPVQFAHSLDEARAIITQQTIPIAS